MDVGDFVKTQAAGLGTNMTLLKERWIRLQMDSRAKEYTTFKPAHVFIGRLARVRVCGGCSHEIPRVQVHTTSTASSPSRTRASRLICARGSIRGPRRPKSTSSGSHACLVIDRCSLCVCRFQELDLSAEAFVFNTSSLEEVCVWLQKNFVLLVPLKNLLRTPCRNGANALSCLYRVQFHTSRYAC
jgi:hypothetical protein